jgi:hypothetical protein
MPESPIRYVQCPYCKKKFGIRRDQEVETCFFCGGTLNIVPKEGNKPWTGFVVTGSFFKRQVNTLLEKMEQVNQPVKKELVVEPVVPEPEPVLELSLPVIEEVTPFIEDDADFDALDLSDMNLDFLDEPANDEKAVVPALLSTSEPIVRKLNVPAAPARREALDPIDRLRPAADDIPTVKVIKEEVPENAFSKYHKKILSALGRRH